MAQNEQIQRNRELSWLVAAVLIVGFISFLVGYFIGTRQGVRDFITAQQEECAVSGVDDAETHIFAEAQPAITKDDTNLTQAATPLVRRYWALVTAVDSYVLAVELMQTAARAGVAVHIKKCIRQLPRGRKKTIYRLVTLRYADQRELEGVLETLKKEPLLAKHMSSNLQLVTDDKDSKSENHA